MCVRVYGVLLSVIYICVCSVRVCMCVGGHIIVCACVCVVHLCVRVCGGHHKL